MVSVRLFVKLFFVCFATAAANNSFSDVIDFSCGSLESSYGPYDYRNQKDKLTIVDSAHFTPKVENLIGGNTGTMPGPDINYTLMTSPNHHRALLSMMRLAEREKTSKPFGAKYTIDCYFKRGIHFRNDDPTVRVIYATYLSKSNRNIDAILQLEQAVELGGESANLYYNIGLVYLDLKQYDKALTNAHRAYQMGFPLPGLRDRLKKEGKWSEAPPPVVESESGQKTEEKAAGEVPGKKPAERSVR